MCTLIKANYTQLYWWQRRSNDIILCNDLPSVCPYNIRHKPQRRRNQQLSSRYPSMYTCIYHTIRQHGSETNDMAGHRSHQLNIMCKHKNYIPTIIVVIIFKTHNYSFFALLYTFVCKWFMILSRRPNSKLNVNCDFNYPYVY